MFQLYKKRGFSEFISDTFSFLKQEGRNYFKNYFIINGPLLLVLVASTYFLSKIYFESMFASLGNVNNVTTTFTDNLTSNIPFFIGIGILFFITIIIVSLINYLFPVCYLKLVALKKEATTKNILTAMKQKAGKTIVFFLASLVIITSIYLIISFIMILLIGILIGIPLLAIVVPAFISWVVLSFFDYMATDNGYFKALGNGFKLLQAKFWSIIGATLVILLIFFIALGIVTMVPYLITMISVYTDPSRYTNNNETYSYVTIVVSVVFVLYILFNYTLQNIILINQGIIYYSVIEENENVSIKSDIDLIGSDSE